MPVITSSAFFLSKILKNMTDHFKAGYIAKAHGIKGAVSIVTEPGCIDFFSVDQPVFLQVKEQLVPYFIEDIQTQEDKATIKFEDVDTQEAAQALKGTLLFLPKSLRPASGRGEFYFDEIIGYSVQENEVMLGKVERVVHEQVNPLLIVVKDEKEFAIPINSPFILSVNKSKKLFTVSLPEGLIDLD
jgi:16S rRNA processing protein RimM